ASLRWAAAGRGGGGKHLAELGLRGRQRDQHADQCRCRAAQGRRGFPRHGDLDPRRVILMPGAGVPLKRPPVLVLGNEKGGSGKSTTAMHLIVALVHAGAGVGSIDLDARQGTLTRYIENRRTTAEQLPLPLWRHIPIEPSRLDSAVAAAAEDRARLEQAVAG